MSSFHSVQHAWHPLGGQSSEDVEKGSLLPFGAYERAGRWNDDIALQDGTPIHVHGSDVRGARMPLPPALLVFGHCAEFSKIEWKSQPNR